MRRLRLFTGIALMGLVTLDAAEKEIHFFDAESAGERILSEEKEAYFSRMQIVELAAYQGREVSDAPVEEQREEYKKLVVDYVSEFTDSEKEALKFWTRQVDEELEEWVPLIADLQWRMLKMDNRFCAGFPHTREDFVVVPAWLAEMSVRAFAEVDKGGGSEFAAMVKEVLMHEKMHVAQRNYLEKFDAIYKELWGFDHIDPVCPHSSLEHRLALNPDALDYGYVTNLRDQWYLPLVLFKDGEKKPVMGRDFLSQFYLLDRDGMTAEMVAKDDKPVTIPLADEDFLFRVPDVVFVQGGGHPHEILAYSATKILGYPGRPGLGNEEKLTELRKAMAEAFARPGE